jgi:HK97 family phage portal protein
MTIRERMSKLFNFGRVAPDVPQRYASWYPAQYLPENLQITMDVALQLSVVWACVDAIAKAIASCHWHVYALKGEQRKFLAEDPLDYILNVRPNAEMTAIGFRESLLYAALTWGNAYAEIVRDGRGAVAELWPLLPERMQVARDTNGVLHYVYTQWDGGQIRLEQSDVLHVRGPSINGLLGENIVARAVKSIALGVAAERFSISFFSNSTVVGGVLEFPRTLDQKTYDRLKKDWEDKRQGPNNAHKPIILEGGAKFTSIGSNPQESQLIEVRKFQMEEICRWYGVPLHKVQHIDRATFNNIEHLGIEFVRDALSPWALRLEQEANWKLFPARGPGARKMTRIDTSWLSQGDFKSRAEGYSILRNIGVYSANDILAKEGENGIGPEGDIRIVGANMQLLSGLPDKAEAELKKLKEPPAPKLLPPGQSGESDLPDEKTPAARVVVREAICALFASAMERYAKRLSNREQDLRRRNLPESQVAGNLAQERERLRPWLLDECSNAMALISKVGGGEPLGDTVVLIAADQVDNGAAPRDVAGQLVAQFLLTGGTNVEV